MDKLKIAIDVGPLTSGDSVRGIGVYTRELLKALNMEGTDVFHTDISKYDIVHFTRFNPFFIALPFKKPSKTKFVITIYDLIPLLYKKHYPPGIKGRLNWMMNKLLIRKNVDAIITISETSKKDICRFTGISPSKVHAIHLAPRDIFKPIANHESLAAVQKKYALPSSFALYVGDVNYNKNIPLMVKACRVAKVPLVICGKQAREIENLDLMHAELKHLKGVDWSGVVRPGFIPDDDLVKIYNLASLYIQPSLYEGFGLPILEANAAGVPVLSSHTQALVEIAEGAAYFADANNLDDFSDKVKKLSSDQKLRKNLIDKGNENAKKYTWQKTAEKTLSVYYEKI